MEAPEGTTLGDVTFDELRLAARNHALPLEALRYPVTPVGLHYLLTHYDIPAVDPGSWRLEIGGSVERPLSLSLGELRSREPVTMPVTLECAGNGRARLAPRPLSQPWLTEAVGNAEWTGVPLAPLLEEAGLRDDAIELLFTGLDRGIEGGVEQSYERSLPRAEALGGDALLAYAINGIPLPPQHGAPLRLVIAGWYGMAHVKWLASITALTEPFEGYQNKVGYRLYADEDDEGVPVTRIMPRSLTIPPGIPDFFTRTRFVDAGPCVLHGRAWSGLGAGRARRGQRRRRRDAGPTPRSASRPARAAGAAGPTSGTPGRASTSSARARPTPPATSSRSSRRGTSRGSRTTRSSGCR